MDNKNRRVQKPITPSKKPSANPLTNATASTPPTKFTIQQKVPSGTGKKGPYSVKRTVDPSDVVIKRRIGEGARPLFSREDICVNGSVSPKKPTATRASSSGSSSPEDRNRHRETTKPTKTPEKVPYFVDEIREKDRIKRVYGRSRRSRSLSNERRRRHRSRSRTPKSYHRRRRSSDRRSSSRDRYRSRHRSKYSRSRSRSRERRSRSHHNGGEGSRHPQLPATQFIPIPVPVEYPFIPPAWGPPMIPPPQRFPYLIRPPLPPPHHYVPRHFPQPGFMPNHYQRGNYRPRPPY